MYTRTGPGGARGGFGPSLGRRHGGVPVAEHRVHGSRGLGRRGGGRRQAVAVEGVLVLLVHEHGRAGQALAAHVGARALFPFCAAGPAH